VQDEQSEERGAVRGRGGGGGGEAAGFGRGGERRGGEAEGWVRGEPRRHSQPEVWCVAVGHGRRRRIGMEVDRGRRGVDCGLVVTGCLAVGVCDWFA
jgi:hypothetical protein